MHLALRSKFLQTQDGKHVPASDEPLLLFCFRFVFRILGESYVPSTCSVVAAKLKLINLRISEGLSCGDGLAVTAWWAICWNWEWQRLEWSEWETKSSLLVWIDLSPSTMKSLLKFY